MRKMQMAVMGIPRDAGGQCDKCRKDRAVAWVHELTAYRCSHCLAEVATLAPEEPASTDVTEDEEYQVSEAWQTIIENAGKMGPPESPRPVEEE
jgi:hypothetical protein